jgi:hypothetical protein
MGCAREERQCQKISSYRHAGWEYGHLRGLPARYVVCLQDATLAPLWQEILRTAACYGAIRVDAGHQVMNTRPHALAEILLLAAAESEAGE